MPRLFLLASVALTTPLAAQTTSAPTNAAGSTAPNAAAQASDDSAYDAGEIVVRGQKPRGSVIGDIAPEVTLSPADIRAYGVNNISDLLDELAPQTGSDRGRGSGAPVVLLNGRRISGLGEIRDLPTEAIQRVEILPEEVSLKYGYSADQRVVNIVLRRRFRALVGEAGAGTTTDGGGTSANPEANLVRIHDDQRFSINARYQTQERLRESQRDVTSVATGLPYDLTGNIAAPRSSSSAEIDPALSALAGQAVTVAGVPVSAAAGAPTLAQFVPTANLPNATDVAPYRTLKASSNTASTNIVYAHPVFARATATLNGSLSYATGDALQGLPGAALTIPTGDPFSPFSRPVALYRYVDDDPLHQRTDTLTSHLGLTVNGDRGHWRWTLTGTYDRTDARTRTATGIDVSALQARLTALDPTNPFAPITARGPLTNRARALTNSEAVAALVSGPLFRMPAGSAGTTIKVGFDADGFDGTSLRSGVTQTSDLSRGNANGQVNLDVPLTSRREHVGEAIGDLSANGNVAVRRLSDFGTLTTVGYGLTWTPIPKLQLIASVTNDQGAPTVQQLGNPVVVTPATRVFDYLAGTTVDVTQTSGGNRALRNDDRRVIKLGATLKPLAKSDLTVIFNYLDTRDKNAIASLPEPTADVEAAFPDRFTRDASGTLIAFNSSPVNFARERQDEIRFGFNFSISLKSAIQRRFEEWIAARRAGKDVPPPFKLSDQQRRRFEQERSRRGGQDGAPPPPPDGAPPPAPDGSQPPPPPDGGGGPGAGGPPPGGGGFGGPPGGGGFGGGGFHGGGFGGGGRGGFGGGRGQQQGGRLQVALYDTWTLKDTVLLRQGGPVIDLLHGGSVTSGGGQPEHKLQLQLGYSNNGLGVRLSGNYQTATRVDAGGTTGDLRFSGLATANLRLFADLGQMPQFFGKRWAQGTRLSVELNNISNNRQRVRDADGDTPLRYQPAYLDPLGRVVRVTLRKVLF